MGNEGSKILIVGAGLAVVYFLFIKKPDPPPAPKPVAFDPAAIANSVGAFINTVGSIVKSISGTKGPNGGAANPSTSDYVQLGDGNYYDYN